MSGVPPTSAATDRPYRWYTLVVALFTTALVISNIIAVKLVTFGTLPALLGGAAVTLPAAVILFPVAYIFGDILTEVYGFARARQAIWIGFACNFLAVVAIALAGRLPPAPFWGDAVGGPDQAGQAYAFILGFTPRLLGASFVAYLAGEFLNSAVLSRLKVATEGRYLWLRTITSTVVGEGVDSALFISLAFAGILPGGVIASLVVMQWLAKTFYEILATPVTYLVVYALKRSEGVDVFDRGAKLTPFGFASNEA